MSSNIQRVCRCSPWFLACTQPHSLLSAVGTVADGSLLPDVPFEVRPALEVLTQAVHGKLNINLCTAG